MATFNITQVDFKKNGGLVPAIIQDAVTLQVLMLGYMNHAALQQTMDSGLVTFFSRGRQQLWIKGETSGNVLHCQHISMDCDQDTLLILARPEGPTCHTGENSCFGNTGNKGFLYKLEQTIAQRIREDITGSYSNNLYRKGINKMAQKLGEEAVELVIEAKDNDPERLNNEAADLLYHLLLLLYAKGSSIETVETVLLARQNRQ